MEANQSTTERTPLGWVAWAWGIGGVVALLLNAVVRLSDRAWSVFEAELTGLQIALTVGWVLFMLYTEAWRGFHLNFSPRVVARSRALAGEAPWLVAVAPVVAMGLIHGTRRRLIVSRVLLLGIIGLILAVRLLPDPWRGMVDLGVVVGLAAGTLSIGVYAVSDLFGRGPQVDPEFPAPVQPSQAPS